MNGNCKGQTLAMFPPESRNVNRRLRNRDLAQRGKDVCEGCPILGKCLKLAVDAGETAGIWGGVWFADDEDVRSSLPRKTYAQWVMTKYRKPGLKSDYR